MSKMNELSMLIEEMIAASNSMAKAAQALKDFYSSTEEKSGITESTPKPAVMKEASAKEEKTYTHEEVRALLSKKANESEGKFKTLVKDLVKKYADGGTLKDITPEKYAALVAELEVVSNA